MTDGMERRMNLNHAARERDAAAWTSKLLTEGYCVIPGLLPPERIAALDSDLGADFENAGFSRGTFYGERTKRFGRLLTRSPIAADLVQHPLVQDVVERVLSPWCDTVQLNLTRLSVRRAQRIRFGRSRANRRSPRPATRFPQATAARPWRRRSGRAGQARSALRQVPSER